MFDILLNIYLISTLIHIVVVYDMVRKGLLKTEGRSKFAMTISFIPVVNTYLCCLVFYTILLRIVR